MLYSKLTNHKCTHILWGNDIHYDMMLGVDNIISKTNIHL